MSNVKRVRLSGSLGRRFGFEHRLAIDSFPEAIRAMSYQLEGFRDFMRSEIGSRMKFAIFVDGRNVSLNDEDAVKCAKEIRIIPVPNGAKSGGLLNIVVGVAIMVAAFYTGGASLAAMGAFSSAAFMAGGAMVLGGIMQMIAPQQGGSNLEVQSSKNKSSYAFGGAVNTTAAGYPIPLPYGERSVGGAVFSAGTYAEDQM
jgi:predicted phage tail protein